MASLSHEELGIQWREDIKSGKKTKEELSNWISVHAPSWSLSERAIFKAGYADQSRPWKEWYAKPPR